ncbi:MAG TPA: hypothetical protein VMH86_07620 [Rhizomicrobium sp.]|nr:hypothetical protein [Rhizomicrobium sp.]
MAKYTPLETYLANQIFAEVPMSFREIERVLGAPLPRSAFAHRPWWANETRGHVHAKSWLSAGFETAQVDMEGKKLVFRRIGRGGPPRSPSADRPHGGMADTRRAFKPGENGPEKKRGASPLWGALKGTFTIEPGHDLTGTAYTDREWTEIEKEMDDDWDEIERGMSGKDA